MLWLPLITPKLTLIILDITKTDSNNCLLACPDVANQTGCFPDRHSVNYA